MITSKRIHTHQYTLHYASPHLFTAHYHVPGHFHFPAKRSRCLCIEFIFPLCFQCYLCCSQLFYQLSNRQSSFNMVSISASIKVARQSIEMMIVRHVLVIFSWIWLSISLNLRLETHAFRFLVPCAFSVRLSANQLVSPIGITFFTAMLTMMLTNHMRRSSSLHRCVVLESLHFIHSCNLQTSPPQ